MVLPPEPGAGSVGAHVQLEAVDQTLSKLVQHSPQARQTPSTHRFALVGDAGLRSTRAVTEKAPED